jgi:hypothetical protein
VIVRIATEGQYRLSEAVLQRLNELDSKLVSISSTKDEAQFARVLADLLEVVRREGTPVPLEDLVASDLILPPPGTTIEEARDLIGEDGMIPG